jgi:Dolichyl-phosphate-mannose-protein mannosyltransferase
MISDSDAPRAADRNVGYFNSGPAVVLYVAAARLLLHLFTASRYGIFRDELYNLACSQHLDWGGIDHPPLIDLIAWFSRHVFGESLLGLRLLPALAGAALIVLTGTLTREMGGGRFAQALSALAVFCVPAYLITDHLLTINAFEPLIWMGCAWCVLRAFDRSSPRYWLVLGIIAGVGLETKYSVTVFLFGLLIGLLCTGSWRILLSPWIWLGAVAALGLFLPNLVWQLSHDLPFLGFIHSVRMSGRDVALPPLAFIGQQAAVQNPVLFPLWLAGLLWLLGPHRTRQHRILGVTFLAVFLTFLVLHGKDYYVAPAYPMLFAAGSIAFENLTEQRWGAMRAAYLSILAAFTLLIIPYVVPVLPVEAFIRYQDALGFRAPDSEHQRNGLLPQYYADEFGWENMVQATAKAFDQLSPSDREKVGIFANDWGQAAAIDFYGPRYGLPRAVCNHANYWLWGPGRESGAVWLVLGSDGAGDRKVFRTVEPVGVVYSQHARLDEHFTIWLGRDLNYALRERWPQMRKWD